MIDLMKANVDDFLSPTTAQDRDKKRNSEDLLIFFSIINKSSLYALLDEHQRY